MNTSVRLGVNIDHIATIREARKTNEPDPIAAALIAEMAGADGITVHLRGDRRHIQERDVRLLREIIKTRLNVEMAATAEAITRYGDSRSRTTGRGYDRRWIGCSTERQSSRTQR